MVKYFYDSTNFNALRDAWKRLFEDSCHKMAAYLEEMYRNSGYQRYERSYQIKCQHKEYTILCKEGRDGRRKRRENIMACRVLPTQHWDGR